MTRTIPAVMQAVVLEEEGGLLVIRDRPVPQPGTNEVLIRMAASPINPSDLGYLRGMGETKRPLPAVPGIEGSGVVVAGGSGVLPRLLVGRRVACARIADRDGAWAEYMVTSAMQCMPLHKSISLELGSMLIVNTMTAVIFLDMIKQGRHKAVVNTAAASQLGQMLVRLSLKHDFTLINVVRRQEQAETLRALGAGHVLVGVESDFDRKLEALTHELNATLVLDAIGGDFTQRLIDASPDGSTLVFYSTCRANPPESDPIPSITTAGAWRGFISRRGPEKVDRSKSCRRRFEHNDYSAPMWDRSRSTNASPSPPCRQGWSCIKRICLPGRFYS